MVHAARRCTDLLSSKNVDEAELAARSEIIVEKGDHLSPEPIRSFGATRDRQREGRGRGILD